MRVDGARGRQRRAAKLGSGQDGARRVVETRERADNQGVERARGGGV